MLHQVELSLFDVGYVKYGYPIAVTTMMLAWGLIEFPQVSLSLASTHCMSVYFPLWSVNMHHHLAGKPWYILMYRINQDMQPISHTIA